MNDMNKKYWMPLVLHACQQYETPFFLFSKLPIAKQLDCMKEVCGSSVSNWLSFKTLPLASVLRWWLKTGLGIEVVSEYELLAAYHEGFPPNRIIVNGVAKHSWNEKCWLEGLRVNFDSVREVKTLSSFAKNKRWKVGIRFHPTIQNDPENNDFPDQFGISADTFLYACDVLRKQEIKVDTVHIHLRSNVPNISFYREALDELVMTLKQTNVELKCLNLGGGLPAKCIKQLDSCWNSAYSIEDLNRLLQLCYEMFPTVDEYILENGRFVLSNCGVLVLTVRDIKEIGGLRYLMCDGGRTNHALLSDWEEHEIAVLPSRPGTLIQTAICGPTCMAFDCISRRKLADNINIGDKVVWFDAGAYNLSWENRFSQPLARVLWHDGNEIFEVRPAESFSQWWGRWR